MICDNEDDAAKMAGIPVEGLGKFINARVRQAIRMANTARSSRVNVYPDDVLRRWWMLANADINELVEVRKINCRYCWGEDFSYQFTLNELRDAELEHYKIQMRLPESIRRPFDRQGGDGFRKDKDPNADCPECCGGGMTYPVFKDTRELSFAGRMLYDGVEISKDGTVKLKLRDRNYAEQMIARHLGMFDRGRFTITVNDPARMSKEDLQIMIDSLPEEARDKLRDVAGAVSTVGEALSDLKPSITIDHHVTNGTDSGAGHYNNGHDVSDEDDTLDNDDKYDPDAYLNHKGDDDNE